jgi:ferredoxin
MRVVVDRSRCESHGLCAATAPGVFDLDDNDDLTILDEHPAEGEWPTVRSAVASCPTQALSFVDD